MCNTNLMIVRNKLKYIVINASYEGICVEFEKTHNHNIGFFTFKLTASTNNRLSWPVKYLFDNFGI